MINRVLIRLKIVQIVYAYYQNGGKNLDTAEKELFFSLSNCLLYTSDGADRIAYCAREKFCRWYRECL